MTCSNQIGIRNILLSFTNCDTGETIGPVSHKLASDDTLPTVKTCAKTNTALSNGRIRVTNANASLSMTIMPNDAIPLSYYQGCASIDAQVEYINGRVLTMNNGAVIDANGSNYEGIELSLIAQEIDELLPEGATIEAA